MTANSGGQGLVVRVAESDDERLTIYRFRFRTLVREMGWGSRHADHDKEIIRDGLDEAARQLYVSRVGGVIAKIDCGRRPLGYVWLHDLIEAVRTRILF